MPVFEDYAHYYDLLYANKDYSAESEFVLGRLKEAGVTCASVLDLGCGTACHALALARRGIMVEGVDLSPDMLKMGEIRLREAQAEVNAAARRQSGPAFTKSSRAVASTASGFTVPQLHHGDARSIRLGKTFDAVISLFHVMSYQNTEKDALDMLTTARAHLAPGGLFFFDFWHGPGVLRALPAPGERTLEDAGHHIKRASVPVHRVEDNVVEVHYQVEITGKDLQNISPAPYSVITEEHHMRYWFLPELRCLAAQSGFTCAAAGGWMHENSPGLEDWNAWMLLRV